MIKKIICIFVLFSAQFAFSENSSSHLKNKYIVNNGKLYLSENKLSEIDSPGEILNAVFSINKVTCLVKRDASLYVAEFADGKWREFKIFEIFGSFSIDQFNINGQVIYFILKRVAVDQESIGLEKEELVRYDLNSGKLNRLENVSYYRNINGKFLVVQDKRLFHDGREINTDIKNIESVKIISSNLIIIRDVNANYQLYDINKHENILYSEVESKSSIVSFEKSDNIKLEFVDMPNPKIANYKREFIFYSIKVNGKNSERTETGYGELKKISSLSLEEGNYSIFKIERYALDKEKGRYVRLNNIYQPGSIKVFMPKNRKIYLRVEFDGIKYRIIQRSFNNVKMQKSL